jgi:hypothetical protein
MAPPRFRRRGTRPVPVPGSSSKDPSAIATATSLGCAGPFPASGIELSPDPRGAPRSGISTRFDSLVCSADRRRSSGDWPGQHSGPTAADSQVGPLTHWPSSRLSANARPGLARWAGHEGGELAIGEAVLTALNIPVFSPASIHKGACRSRGPYRYRSRWAQQRLTTRVAPGSELHRAPRPRDQASHPASVRAPRAGPVLPPRPRRRHPAQRFRRGRGHPARPCGARHTAASGDRS